MAGGMTWKIVKRFGKPIGGIGFIDGRAAMVVSFTEDADANGDGSVSKPEWIAAKLFAGKMKGRAVAEVALQGRGDPDILEMDPEFGDFVANRLNDFTRPAIVDAMYKANLSVMISKAAGGVASAIGGGAVKEFVMKKGMEAAVKTAYDQGMKP